MNAELTEEMWDASDWPNRVRMLKEVYKCKTFKALAAELRVQVRSLDYWRTGGRKPSIGKANELKQEFLSRVISPEKEDAYLFILSPIIDAGASMVELATTRQSMYMRSAIAGLLASKVAESIKAYPGMPRVVITIKSVYGATPAKADMDIQIVGNPSLSFHISLNEVKYDKVFAIAMTSVYNGIASSKTFAEASDKGVLHITKKIWDTTTKLEKSQSWNKRKKKPLELPKNSED